MSKYPFLPYLVPYRSRYAWGLINLFVVDAINVALPLLVKLGIDAVTARDRQMVVVAASSYLGLMLFQAVGRYLWRVYLIGTSNYISRDLRTRLYDHCQRLPWTFWQEHKSGDVLSRATNDVESVRMAVGPGVLVALDAIFLLVMIIPVMFWLSRELTLYCLCLFPIVPLLTERLGGRIDKYFEVIQKKLSRMSSHVLESFTSIRLIKSGLLESWATKRLRDFSLDYADSGKKLAKFEAVFSPSLTLIMNLGLFLLLCVGSRRVIDGVLTIGTFVAFQRFVGQLSWPMEAVGWVVTMHREATAANRRIQQLLSVQEVPVSIAPLPAGPADLRIERLQFAFPNSSFALDLSHLDIHRGQRIGLVGQVGCGKSTLFNLLGRIYEPTAGSVFWRGGDITGVGLGNYRREIVSVEQPVVLFRESVRSNMQMGLGDCSVSELERASFTAAFSMRDEGNPINFDTEVGERAMNLSGGQRQRVALARALVRNPKLLLLDDCFSAVDPHIEQTILERLLREYPQTGLLLSTHRLWGMPYMDEIWVMEKGKLAARGTHTELLKTSRLYQQLWASAQVESESKELSA